MVRKLETGVVVALGLALVFTFAASGRDTLTGPGTIKITDRLVKRTHVDGGRPGRGAGDIDFYRGALFNKAKSSAPIGHSDITCINTGTGSLNCSGTYFLPLGKIMVEGVIGSHLFFELAVVGGTELYDNVGGNLTVTSLGGSPAGELLVFRLEV
ncbi:MAG TPA: hypothetical protein VG265_11135 [Gaiellaceae bacterium]|jgi:hypothetical protein|nr:hypothetical protein [Gaiellaceae bacterium]